MHHITKNMNKKLISKIAGRFLGSLFISVVFTAGMFTTGQITAAEVDTAQLERQCSNITAQQRQMAKAAGYDIDSACNSLQGLKSTSKTQTEQLVPTVIPRGSEFETDERGMILGDSLPGLEQEQNTPQMDQFTADKSDKKLKRYGYELFAGIPTTFAPATDIPVPVDYLMGPGDSMQIQLLGKVNESMELTVARDGAIKFPDLGPISVSGLKFSTAKELIQQKVTEQMIGVRAVISLGELRSIRIFVLGEAFKPGSYTVSSLSTMTNALFASGGITDIGSLRNIQLKRQGKLITTLDLYDLLQRGDTKNDARLLPGDVIYIPTVGVTAGIQGEVKRPAIYELKNKKSLKSLIRLAGGYSPNAYPNVSHITRKSKNGFTTVIDVDLSQLAAKSTQVKNGDLVEISTVLEEYEDVVELMGAFHRERSVKWRDGLTLAQVIKSVTDFKEGVDLNAGLIIRKEMPFRKVSVLQFNLQDLLVNKGKSANNIKLQPLDTILTFLQDGTRVENLEPLITQLKDQNYGGGLTRIVEIGGNVRFPGSYPLAEGMNVRKLVLLAGGLGEASYLGNAEVTTRDLSNAEIASVKHVNVNLSEQLTGINDYRLSAKDKLTVYTTPEYREHMTIALEGEVRFPGTYEFRQGETLSQVIHRAGGFTATAHMQAAVFTRVDLKIQEAKQLENLKDQLREDIAASELEDAAAGKGSSLKDAEGLLNALAGTEALGRLVISLEDIMSSRTEDIQLKNLDSLIIPTLRQEISVLGEVQHSASHLYHEEWTVNDYLD
ncbi:MAG: SLBB domain-containing protein, partial [Kangiellaceae bacterium]|nr:SLBB domain-containing protein [Kangiellaceae bacterium]